MMMQRRWLMTGGCAAAAARAAPLRAEAAGGDPTLRITPLIDGPVGASLAGCQQLRVLLRGLHRLSQTEATDDAVRATIGLLTRRKTITDQLTAAKTLKDSDRKIAGFEATMDFMLDLWGVGLPADLPLPQCLGVANGVATRTGKKRLVLQHLRFWRATSGGVAEHVADAVVLSNARGRMLVLHDGPGKSPDSHSVGMRILVSAGQGLLELQQAGALDTAGETALGGIVGRMAELDCACSASLTSRHGFAAFTQAQALAQQWIPTLLLRELPGHDCRRIYTRPAIKAS